MLVAAAQPGTRAGSRATGHAAAVHGRHARCRPCDLGFTWSGARPVEVCRALLATRRAWFRTGRPRRRRPAGVDVAAGSRLGRRWCGQRVGSPNPASGCESGASCALLRCGERRTTPRAAAPSAHGWGVGAGIASRLPGQRSRTACGYGYSALPARCAASHLPPMSGTEAAHSGQVAVRSDNGGKGCRLGISVPPRAGCAARAGSWPSAIGLSESRRTRKELTVPVLENR
jgi:hypothetical protein